MRCPNCGNENPPDYVFCDECGARLQEGEGTENSPNIPAQEGSTPPTDIGTGSSSGQEEDPSSTPDHGDTPLDDSEPQAEALSTTVSGETTGSAEEMAQDDAAIPVTEDTMAAAISTDDGPADDEGMSGDGSSLSAQSMPDVVEIGASEGSMAGTDRVEIGASPVSVPDPDISPAASGTPAVAGDGGSAGWASTALHHLDEAQQAMAKGDYVGYDQSLDTLKSLLESISSGTSQTTDTDSAAPTPISHAHEQSSGSAAASSPDSLGSIPVVEPAAEAGTLTAEPATGSAQEEMSPAVSVAPGDGIGQSPTPSAVARLVVISTGAELSLPEQEEISVGREDPSSGIFPDVDLTPYGGEEGGVSRRHARLLHIGDDYFVEDLQATNFTKLDGQRLPAHAREKIEDGARLDFGRVAVIFRRS